MRPATLYIAFVVNPACSGVNGGIRVIICLLGLAVVILHLLDETAHRDVTR